MQERFYELVDHVTGLLQGEEVLLASFSGERSDFIRFNNARVRQAGNVVQRALTLAYFVVGVELVVIAMIRHRYFKTSFALSCLQVIVGGGLVFAAGVLIEQS